MYKCFLCLVAIPYKFNYYNQHFPMVPMPNMSNRKPYDIPFRWEPGWTNQLETN